jgi:hypothetical protein
MIFVQGESATVAKLKITSTFQSLLSDEGTAREYLKEVSRDLSRLKEQDYTNRHTIWRETLATNRLAEQIYDFDSLHSIQKTINNLYSQLQPLPRKTNKEILISWSIQLTAFASIILLAMWIIN